jgi:hypothetical protein
LVDREVRDTGDEVDEIEEKADWWTGKKLLRRVLFDESLPRDHISQELYSILHRAIAIIESKTTGEGTFGLSCCRGILLLLLLLHSERSNASLKSNSREMNRMRKCDLKEWHLRVIKTGNRRENPTLRSTDHCLLHRSSIAAMDSLIDLHC